MEKKIGKNVSSGAEKVDAVEKKISAEKAQGKSGKKPSPQRKKSVNAAKKGQSRAVKKEKAAAAKRVEKAKKKEAAKQEKALKKAELKQKKIEKKAEIKRKKLERKELIAKKRAERKQAKLEKRAALKEKKAEQRAQKAARREMLKNETKTEKQKRISREKKERIALRRSRHEARVKAREDRRKAREAAHERRAQNKRHKREQKTKRKENRRGFGGWLAAVITLGVVSLALATVVTYGAFEMNDMQAASESGYRATLYELVSVTEDMDNNLSKLRVATGANEQRVLLTDILVDTALMESAVERIPVDQATGTDISAFINDVNRYARGLLSRIASGKTLSEEETERVESLYRVNAQLGSELNDLVTHMTAEDFTDFLSGEDGEISQRFGEMGQTVREQPEEIMDAPFSREGNVGENRLDRLPEISAAEAQEKLEGYLKGYRLVSVEYTGETTSPLMTCYNFEMEDENGVELFAEITKRGGKLAFFDTYETCTGKNFDLETCDGLARKFLSEIGIDGLEAVWLSDGGMVANIDYAGLEDGVRVYPDSVRVRVCESKGRVVGVDARGYLVNHCDRTFRAELTEEEARETLSSRLTVTAVNRALIPAGGREASCYEFACDYGEEKFLVYVDAVTGEEVRMFRVRESARGSYLE